MKIYYLQHSGFVIDLGDKAYVFDYYKDPKKIVNQLQEEGRKLYFFVSHVHFDHYAKEILDFPGVAYVYHEDVPLRKDIGETSAQLYPMAVGDTIDMDGLRITMHGSTDAGGSFEIHGAGHSWFYAGDLNWWHWLGDTEENKQEAKDLQEEHFKTLAGMAVDVAFFPVDARLEGAREWGVIEFLRLVKADVLIPMHYNGAPWEPSEYVHYLFRNQQYWIPQQEGDVYQS